VPGPPTQPKDDFHLEDTTPHTCAKLLAAVILDISRALAWGPGLQLSYQYVHVHKHDMVFKGSAQGEERGRQQWWLRVDNDEWQRG
jgi:hypothetical protein